MQCPLMGSQPAPIMSAIERKAAPPGNPADHFGKFVQLPMFEGKLDATAYSYLFVNVGAAA